MASVKTARYICIQTPIKHSVWPNHALINISIYKDSAKIALRMKLLKTHTAASVLITSLNTSTNVLNLLVQQTKLKLLKEIAKIARLILTQMNQK